MDYKDYYKILGVSKTASQDEKTRKLAMKYHLIRMRGDKQPRRFKEVNEAMK
jgi:curved DNA-binding protein